MYLKCVQCTCLSLQPNQQDIFKVHMVRIVLQAQTMQLPSCTTLWILRSKFLFCVIWKVWLENYVIFCREAQDFCAIVGIDYFSLTSSPQPLNSPFVPKAIFLYFLFSPMSKSGGLLLPPLLFLSLWKDFTCKHLRTLFHFIIARNKGAECMF